MSRRRGVVAAVMLVVLAVPVGPAAASHDDHGPGTVILNDAYGADDRVVVVYPPDADEGLVTDEVRDLARQAGIALSDVEAVKNQDPDTLRVRAQTPLGERSGFLQRRIPAKRIAVWDVFGDDTQTFVSLSRWARSGGGQQLDGSDLAVDGDADVAYHISGWALGLPLVVVLGAAVFPYVGLRLYGNRVVRGHGAPEERLHLLRRGTLTVQFVVPVALVVVLLLTDSVDWGELAVSEVLAGAGVPASLTRVLGLLGFLLPLVVAMLAAVVAVVPFDRQLRGSEQSARVGASQALRGLVVVFLPLLVWFTLITAFPTIRGWALLPILLLFLVGFAATAPLLMNAIMDTRPVDPLLRSRILQMCADQGVPVRDVRLLDSRGGRVANAAFSGILPRLRYVFVTDHLVEIMDDDELDAVLAHEIGHGKGHHLVIKMVAGLVAIGVLLGLAAGARTGLALLADVVGVRVMLLATPLAVVVVLLFVHGVVGIALEKRADDYASRIAGNEPLRRALDKLADASKMKRRTGWLWNVLQQHPGMEHRIARLTQQVPGTGQPRRA